MPRTPGSAPTRSWTIRAALLFAASTAWAQETAISKTVIPALHPLGLNPIVRMAVFEAHRRLGDPVCQEVFSEFRDGSGEALQRRLDAIGQSGQSYLGWIWFVDAGVGGRCVESDVVAFTSPRSQVVSFCGDRFTRLLSRQGIGPLATAVIHEELHSLGLDENPPSSLEITRRVERRCGS